MPEITAHSVLSSLKPEHFDDSNGIKGLKNLLIAHKESDDPFYIADLSEIGRLYAQWEANLNGITPYYAVKCNTDLNLLKRLISLGAGFDCASREEIKLMLSLGVDPEKIIFANTCKPPSHIKFARNNGVNCMTVDNLEELDKIHQIHPKAKLIIRIKTDDESSVYPISIKFGVDMQDIPLLLNHAIELGLNMIGVSFHVGSGCTDPLVFKSAIRDSRQVFSLAYDYGFNFNLLDIGGGFSCAGLAVATIKFESFTSVINESIKKYFYDIPNIKLVAEPGRFFAASVFKLVTKVCSRRKKTNNVNEDTEMAYYINDGFFGSFSVTKINPSNPNWTLLRSSKQGITKISEEPTCSSWIWGPTCAPIDVVVRDVSLPILEVSDWIIFHNMGAYTSSIATNFNGFSIPSVYYTIQ